MDKKTCEHCGKEHSGRTLKGFCESCYKKLFYSHKKVVKKITCCVCKKQFEAIGNAASQKKYCSDDCCIKHKAVYNKSKHIKRYKKEWAQSNRDKTRISSQKAYQKSKQNPTFRVKIALISRLRFRIRNKTLSTSKLAMSNLDCSIIELMTYLESKFLSGMSWDNYGRYGWHIDHIHPLSKFDLADPEELKKACHYSNLQPLWAKDNLSKGNRFDL